MFMESQLYSDKSYFQKIAVEEMLDGYKNKIRWTKDEIVLDVGCGPGNITSSMEQKYSKNISKIVGIDLSPGMVSHANKKHSSSKLSFYKMDITEKNQTDLKEFLPDDLKSVKFNKIFCFHLFHWLGEKYQQAFCNLESLLEIGGQGVAIHYVSIPCFETYNALSESPKWSPYLAGVNTNYNPMRLRSDPAEFIKNSLIDAGLEPEDINQYSSHIEYNSYSDLVGLLTAVDPLLQYIPKSRHPEYVEDMVSIFLTMCDLSKPGTTKMPFTGMNCLFTKK